MLRKPLFVALCILATSLLALAGAGWLMMQNFGAVMASMPINVPIDAPARYAEAKARLDASTDELSRYYALGDVALWSVDVGMLDDAVRDANELLVLAEKHSRNWNAGNAVHKGHSALGRVAVKRGDIAGAVRELQLAATSKGSPQMNSFGPNMTLARDLIRTRQASARAAVLAHLDYLPTFWKMDNGAIDVWRADVKRGEMPNFGAHLLY